MGTSYDGFEAMAAATENPPHLKLVIAGSYPWAANNSGGYKDVRTETDLTWLHYVSSGTGAFAPEDSGLASLKSDVLAQLVSIADYRKYDSIVYGETIPEWQRLCAHSADPKDPFWQERSLESRFSRSRVPTYHLAGLGNVGDGAGMDTVNGFNLSQATAPAGLHHLIVGYWDHGVLPQYNYSLLEPADHWLGHYLKNEPLAADPAVKFVTEENENSTSFAQADRYPLPQLATKTFYLDSTDLSENPPPTAAGVDLTIDPNEIEPSEKSMAGFVQTFSEPVQLLGEVDLEVNLSLSTPQTDILFVLYKIHQGQHEVLGKTASKVVRQGNSTHVSLKIGPLLTKMEAGDSLLLFARGTNFPSMMRNTNVAAGPNYFDKIQPASIKILTGGPKPSVLKISTQPSN
jgi:predicted acyl esterase